MIKLPGGVLSAQRGHIAQVEHVDRVLAMEKVQEILRMFQGLKRRVRARFTQFHRLVQEVP